MLVIKRTVHAKLKSAIKPQATISFLKKKTGAHERSVVSQVQVIQTFCFKAFIHAHKHASETFARGL